MYLFFFQETPWYSVDKVTASACNTIKILESASREVLEASFLMLENETHTQIGGGGQGGGSPGEQGAGARENRGREGYGRRKGGRRDLYDGAKRERN